MLNKNSLVFIGGKAGDAFVPGIEQGTLDQCRLGHNICFCSNSIHTVTAFLYSGLGGRPFWNTAILAPRFIASAFGTEISNPSSPV